MVVAMGAMLGASHMFVVVSWKPPCALEQLGTTTETAAVSEIDVDFGQWVSKLFIIILDSDVLLVGFLFLGLRPWKKVFWALFGNITCLIQLVGIQSDPDSKWDCWKSSQLKPEIPIRFYTTWNAYSQVTHQNLFLHT